MLAPGPYKAVVTFSPSTRFASILNECISETVLSTYRGDGDGEVLRKLLMHVNQRFRFNYVLGNGPQVASTDDDEDDEDDAAEPAEETAADGVIDLDATNALLSEDTDCVARHCRSPRRPTQEQS